MILRRILVKTPRWFKSKDVTNIEILLAVAAVLLGYLSFLHFYSVKSQPSLHWTMSKDRGLRKATVQTRCYKIPYTREQLLEIEKTGGTARDELNRVLREKTKDEDLERIVSPPRVEFDEKTAKVCLDFDDDIEPQENSFEPHLA